MKKKEEKEKTKKKWQGTDSLFIVIFLVALTKRRTAKCCAQMNPPRSCAAFFPFLPLLSLLRLILLIRFAVVYITTPSTLSLSLSPLHPLHPYDNPFVGQGRKKEVSIPFLLALMLLIRSAFFHVHTHIAPPHCFDASQPCTTGTSIHMEVQYQFVFS